MAIENYNSVFFGGNSNINPTNNTQSTPKYQSVFFGGATPRAPISTYKPTFGQRVGSDVVAAVTHPLDTSLSALGGTLDVGTSAINSIGGLFGHNPNLPLAGQELNKTFNNMSPEQQDLYSLSKTLSGFELGGAAAGEIGKGIEAIGNAGEDINAVRRASKILSPETQDAIAKYPTIAKVGRKLSSKFGSNIFGNILGGQLTSDSTNVKGRLEQALLDAGFAGLTHYGGAAIGKLRGIAEDVGGFTPEQLKARDELSQSVEDRKIAVQQRAKQAQETMDRIDKERFAKSTQDRIERNGRGGTDRNKFNAEPGNYDTEHGNNYTNQNSLPVIDYGGEPEVPEGKAPNGYKYITDKLPKVTGTPFRSDPFSQDLNSKSQIESPDNKKSIGTNDTKNSIDNNIPTNETPIGGTDDNSNDASSNIEEAKDSVTNDEVNEAKKTYSGEYGDGLADRFTNKTWKFNIAAAKTIPYDIQKEIAAGRLAPPEGVDATFIWGEVKKRAELEGDGETLADIHNSKASPSQQGSSLQFSKNAQSKNPFQRAYDAIKEKRGKFVTKKDLKSFAKKVDDAIRESKNITRKGVIDLLDNTKCIE